MHTYILITFIHHQKSSIDLTQASVYTIIDQIIPSKTMLLAMLVPVLGPMSHVPCPSQSTRLHKVSLPPIRDANCGSKRNGPALASIARSCSPLDQCGLSHRTSGMSTRAHKRCESSIGEASGQQQQHQTQWAASVKSTTYSLTCHLPTIQTFF